MPTHASLTDPNIHEPKDISTAPANTAYMADGSGSGDWRQIGLQDMDTGSVKGVGTYRLQAKVADIANVSSTFIPIIADSRLDRIVVIIDAAITGADAILSFKNAGSSTMSSVTIPFATSAAAEIADVNVTTSNTILDGSYIKIDCDGGPTGGTSNAQIIMFFTLV